MTTRLTTRHILFCALLFLPAGLAAAEADQATLLFQKGLRLYQTEDYSAAMDLFTQALLRRPHDREIQTYIISAGQRLLEKEEQQIDIRDVDQIVRNAQEVLKARRRKMRETLQKLKLAYEASRTQDPESLLRACRGMDLLVDISLGQDEESRQIKNYLHSICENLKEGAEAGVRFNEVDHRQVQAYLAFCRSDWKEATNHFTAVINAHPQDARVKKVGRYVWEKARDQEKREIATALREKARLAIRQGEEDRAAQFLSQALEADPTDREALSLLEEVRADLEKSARKKSVREHRRLAEENEKAARWLDAANNWLDILELDPLDEGARRRLGRIRARLAGSVREITGEEEPVSPKRDPAQSEKFYTLGLISYSNGKLEEAAAQFEKSIHLDSANDYSRRALERVREEMRQGAR